MSEKPWLFPGALVEYCHDGTWRVGATRTALVLKVSDTGDAADISVTKIAVADVVKKNVGVGQLRRREVWRTR